MDMTVKELIEVLKEFDTDKDVIACHPGIDDNFNVVGVQDVDSNDVEVQLNLF